MRKLMASILLLIFTGFIASIAVNYAQYVKFLNGGMAVEEVTSFPEEHNEKSASDSQAKEYIPLADRLQLAYFSNCSSPLFTHQFSVVENAYFDVPYSPPEFS